MHADCGSPNVTPDAGGLSPEDIEKLEALRVATAPVPWAQGGPRDEMLLGMNEVIADSCNQEAGAYVVALVNAAPALLHSARVLQEIVDMAREQENMRIGAESLLAMNLREAERRAASVETEKEES